MGQAMKVIFGPGESLDADLKWVTPTPGTPTPSWQWLGILRMPAGTKLAELLG
jgi:hypothetical protein